MKLIKNGEILLYGRVGLSHAFNHFTEHDVVNALLELGDQDEIVIRMNSGGGDAFVGATIHNYIKAHDAKVTLYVDGIAASAASVIAMAADEIVMNDGSLMMIHNPSSVAIGTSKDMRTSINMLDKVAASMINLYAKRSKASAKKIGKMMDDETWMTSEEAVAQGFADREDEDAEAQSVDMFDYRTYKNAPKALMSLAEANASLFEKEEAKPPRADAEICYPPETERNQPMSEKTKGTAPQAAAKEPAVDLEAEKQKAVDAAMDRAKGIVQCDAAKNNTAQADYLAYETKLPVEQCVKILELAQPAETTSEKAEENTGKDDVETAQANAVARVNSGLETMDEPLVTNSGTDKPKITPMQQMANLMYKGDQNGAC